MANRKRHLPWEEEARLLGEVIDFFTEHLPRAVGDSLDHLDESALSMEMFERLSELSDAQLAELGLHREDISKMAASMSGLFKVAHEREQRRG